MRDSVIGSNCRISLGLCGIEGLAALVAVEPLTVDVLFFIATPAALSMAAVLAQPRVMQECDLSAVFAPLATRDAATAVEIVAVVEVSAALALWEIGATASHRSLLSGIVTSCSVDALGVPAHSLL